MGSLNKTKTFGGSGGRTRCPAFLLPNDQIWSCSVSEGHGHTDQKTLGHRGEYHVCVFVLVFFSFVIFF